MMKQNMGESGGHISTRPRPMAPGPLTRRWSGHGRWPREEKRATVATEDASCVCSRLAGPGGGTGWACARVG